MRAPEEQEAGAPARRARATAAPVSPRLLDVDGAAGYLAVSPWTIRDMIAAGRLPRVRLPLAGDRDCRRLLIDREDLDRLIAQAKESSSAERPA
jgi:excisionase family DNA binding protein